MEKCFSGTKIKGGFMKFFCSIYALCTDHSVKCIFYFGLCKKKKKSC